MKTPVLLCLLALAVSPLAHAQAVAPPQAAPPLIVQQPPSYPGTTYTPPGTGLPTPGQPGSAARDLPRSPNKRVLPDEFSAKREAGVWAADDVEPPTAMAYVRRLYDVIIPAQKESGDNLAQTTVSACLRSLARAADAKGLTQTLKAYPADVRKCLAARALLACVQRGWEATEAARMRAQDFDAVITARRRAALEHAQRVEAAYCSGVAVTAEQDYTNREVIAEWLKALKEGLVPTR